MLHLAYLCLSSVATAEAPAAPAETWGVAGTAASATSASPEDTGFDAILAVAKDLYFGGEADEARELLQGLQLRLYAGEKPDWPSAVDAMTYLGEILYLRGDKEQAEQAFQYILSKDPETPISPYSHSVEVVTLFELVRASVVKAGIGVVPTVLPPSPAPAWVFLPFGLPQFAQKRPLAGLTYGTVQVGLATTSLALRSHVRKQVDPPKRQFAPGVVESNEEIARDVHLFQWPATIGFYLTWGIAVVDASSYRQRHPPVPVVGATPEGTVTFGISGSL